MFKIVEVSIGDRHCDSFFTDMEETIEKAVETAKTCQMTGASFALVVDEDNKLVYLAGDNIDLRLYPFTEVLKSEISALRTQLDHLQNIAFGRLDLVLEHAELKKRNAFLEGEIARMKSETR